MKKMAAFTLIEVLIALVILAISLTALIRATSANIDDLAQIRARTTAHLLADSTLTKVQMGLVTAPKPPFFNELNEKAFNKDWKITVQAEDSDLKALIPLTIKVYLGDEKTPLSVLKGFR